MVNIKTLLFLAVLAIVLVGCAKVFSKSRNQTKALTSFATMGVEEFQNYIADPTVQLLDVRTPEEFDEGHIAGALLVDVNDTSFVDKAMAVLNPDRPVAVYCRSGRRSARAASQLAGLGLRVTNLAGGVIAWQDEGKALVQ